MDFPLQLVFGDGGWDAVWEDERDDGAGRHPRDRCATPPWTARRSRSPPTASTSRRGSSRRCRTSCGRRSARRRPSASSSARSRASPRRPTRSSSRPTSTARASSSAATRAALVREVNKKAPIQRARFSAITKDEIERAFAELGRGRRLPRAGGRVAPGHRPRLGRGAHALPHDGQVRGLRQREVRRSRADADARSSSSSASASARRSCPRTTGRCKGAFAARRRRSSPPGTRPTASRAEADAERVMDAVAGATSGTVTAVEKKRRKVAPPTPFNTTALQAAAAAEGLTPARTMRIAESLYMDGLISYPRVDNTVYPPSLDLQAASSSALPEVPVYREHVQRILAGAAARHARREGDHRPPADPPDRRRRSGEAQARGVEALQPRRAPLHGHAVGRRRSSRARKVDHRRRAASRSSPRATSSSMPGFRAHLPLRPEEGRAAAGAGRGRRRSTSSAPSWRRSRPSRRRATARASSSRRWRSAGWARRPRATPSSSASSRSRYVAERAARADVPGPRRHRRALAVRAAHHHAGHDERARSRDGRHRQRPHRARATSSTTRASCSREVDGRAAAQGRRGRRDAQGGRRRRREGRRRARSPATTCSSSPRPRRGASSWAARAGRSATSPTRCRRARSRPSTSRAPSCGTPQVKVIQFRSKPRVVCLDPACATNHEPEIDRRRVPDVRRGGPSTAT